MCSTKFWNRFGLSVRPIGIWSNLKKPRGVLKTVKFWLVVSFGIRQKPSENVIHRKGGAPFQCVRDFFYWWNRSAKLDCSFIELAVIFDETWLPNLLGPQQGLGRCMGYENGLSSLSLGKRPFYIANLACSANTSFDLGVWLV